jgi:hypothetical protein
MLVDSKEYLETLNLYGTDSSTKFIPDEYLFNSINNRIELLHGLIDTDGTVGKNGITVYSTVSKLLCKNVRELVLSLGGSCRVSKKQGSYKDKNGNNVICKISYLLTISFPKESIEICSIPRKKERLKYRDKYEFNKLIKSIEYSHQEEAICIFVENDDHLYVTEDYILTHNTTTLTKIANTGVDEGKNVLQIIFEDTEDQVRRKHYAIWSGIPLDKIDDNSDLVKERVLEHFKDKTKVGDLIIKKFSDDGTTILDVRRWIERYQKKYNKKFDLIVLDYLDCLESHKKAIDQNQSELFIIKSFITMAADYDIPCWSALQTNRTGLDAEWVETHMMGGNIKRLQKSHFVMSIAKTAEQREGGELANIKILKARFASDGHMFRDCIFNNKTMEIRITDPRWNNKQKPDTEDGLMVLDSKAEDILRADMGIEEEQPPNLYLVPSIAIDSDNVEEREKIAEAIMNKHKTDFSENIFGNVGVIVTLRTPLPKDVTFISNIININKNVCRTRPCLSIFTFSNSLMSVLNLI